MAITRMDIDPLNEGQQRRDQVGVAFAFLIKSLSESQPDLKTDSTLINQRAGQLRSEQANAVRFIFENTTPEELVDIIFKNPPKAFYKTTVSDEILSVQPTQIEVTEPTKDDLDYSTLRIAFSSEIVDIMETKLKTTKASQEANKYIENLNNEISRYLRAPKIKDGLTYTERKKWEKSVVATLQLIDEIGGLKSKANDEVTETDQAYLNNLLINKDLWARAFGDRYGYTKYSTNTSSTAVNYASIIEYLLPENSPDRYYINSFCEKIKSITKDHPNDNETRADLITTTFKDFIDHFTTK